MSMCHDHNLDAGRPRCRRRCHCRVQVVYGHLDDPENQEIQRGVSYLRLRPGEGEGQPDA